MHNFYLYDCTYCDSGQFFEYGQVQNYGKEIVNRKSRSRLECSESIGL